MNSAELLRVAMSDRPKFANENYTSDGTATTYQLSGFPLVTGSTALGSFQPSAFVAGASGNMWSATGATFNLLFGVATIPSAIPFGQPIQFQYTWGVMSDQEIDFLTAQDPGDLVLMQIHYIDWLLADYAKRARWNAGGVSYDETRLHDFLINMREVLWKRTTLEQGPQGGIESWYDQQENFA